MPKVLCAALNTGVGPHLEILRKGGFEIIVPPADLNLYIAENLLKVAPGCEAIIAGSEEYSPSTLRKLPGLRVLSRTGVGFDAIDVPTCDELGIVIATTPGVNHHAVAEQTFGLLFGVVRRIVDRDRRVRKGDWTRISSPRMMGRTLSIIGLGRIGRAVATRAVGLGLKVVAYDPYPPEEFVEQWGIKMCSFDEALQQGDYVTLHLPSSPQTRHCINRGSLAKMKRGAVLINTARGALVDEAALFDALKSGHLSGAGLDVFDVEPLALESPLLSDDNLNVVFTNHTAGLDDESQHATLVMAGETIVSLYQGGWPTPCIRNLAGVKNWKW